MSLNEAKWNESYYWLLYSVSQKNSPWRLVTIFPIFWEFFNRILQAYYAFLFTLECEFLFNYLQHWRSYAILSVTTQFTSCAQNVHRRLKRTLAFSDIFPKQLINFSPNFTRLLYVHIYIRVHILSNYLQLWRSCAILSATTRRAFRSMVDILSTLSWSRWIWHKNL